jgi:hypothetical protein
VLMVVFMVTTLSSCLVSLPSLSGLTFDLTLTGLSTLSHGSRKLPEAQPSTFEVVSLSLGLQHFITLSGHPSIPQLPLLEAVSWSTSSLI